MKRLQTVLAIAFLGLLLGFKPVQNYTLAVNVTNADPSTGYVLLILFEGAEGFPSDQDKAKAYDGEKVSNGQATIVFHDLPEGEYAIAAFHDANSNGKMDTNMLGIPKEAYGASNDAKGTLGPPKFEDARFEIQGDTEITIKLRKVF